jgi:hypothetical protein
VRHGLFSPVAFLNLEGIITMRVLSTLFALAVLSSAGPSLAAEPLTLMLGDDASGRAELVFQTEMSAEDAFLLKTTRVGAPGSVVTLSIDRSKTPLLTHTFSPDECSFATGEAVCEAEIAGGSPAYRDLVSAFKAGLNAHLTVVTAGQMQMQTDASLQGFTEAFGKL